MRSAAASVASTPITRFRFSADTNRDRTNVPRMKPTGSAASNQPTACSEAPICSASGAASPSGITARPTNQDSASSTRNRGCPHTQRTALNQPSPGSPAAGRCRTRSCTSSAATRKVSASIARAHDAPSDVTRSPPPASPMSMVMLFVIPRRSWLRRYSSSSVNTSRVRAFCAALAGAPARRARTTSTHSGASGIPGTAMVPTSTACTAADVTRTVLRGSRSASCASPRPPASAGRKVRAYTTAAHRAEPVRLYTTMDSATVVRWSPRTDCASAIHRARNSRLRTASLIRAAVVVATNWSPVPNRLLIATSAPTLVLIYQVWSRSSDVTQIGLTPRPGAFRRPCQVVASPMSPPELRDVSGSRSLTTRSAQSEHRSSWTPP